LFLLEDVDAIGRKHAITKKANKDDNSNNDNNNTEISLVGILNALDWLHYPEHYIVNITTNYKDKLDPVLIGPGQIDYSVEFTAATEY